MLPETEINLTDVDVVTLPSRTYHLDVENKRIGKIIDGQDAILQVVQKILSTERYAYVIYSSEYGVELERLLGQDYDYVVSEIERTISDALLVDERITAVHSFEFYNKTQSSVAVSFTVDSNQDSIEVATEVALI